MRSTTFLAVAALALFAAGQAVGEPMRCGTHLVDVGSSVYELEKHCGPPAFRQGGEWIYDRGPDQLDRIVRIADGEVQSIRTEGEEHP
jgi:hypothetical protein